MMTERERVKDALARYRFMSRHLRKRMRKFNRRVGPLIKRIERARARLERGDFI